MSFHNPYEILFLGEDRIETIAHQVKQYRGTNKDHSLTLGRILSVVVILGALLSIFIGQ